MSQFWYQTGRLESYRALTCDVKPEPIVHFSLLTKVKILISYKADLTLKDHEGCTPLHLACGSSLDSAMELQTTIVVENLTSHGAGVNAKVGNILDI